MKRWGLIAGLWMVLFSWAMSHQSLMHQNQSAIKASPSYLYVIEAQSGVLQKIPEYSGRYHLTLDQVDVDHILAFSDRPYRIVRYTSAHQLKKDWAHGQNNFVEDPPNAVLLAKGHSAQVVVLEDMRLDAKQISFDVRITQMRNQLPQRVALEHITLVIDNAN